MRFIIFLASNDTAAKSNYVRLVGGRESASSVNEKPQNALLDYNSQLNEFECPKPKIIQNLQNPETPIEIDLIAHGNPNNPHTLLIQPKFTTMRRDEPIVFSEVTPSVIADFFIKNKNKETGKHNFENLTLFCCQGKTFGQALSEKMPEVKITCFDENIRIDHFCIAYNDATPPAIATPYIFLNGILQNNLEDKLTDEKPSPALEQQENFLNHSGTKSLEELENTFNEMLNESNHETNDSDQENDNQQNINPRP